MGDISPHFNRSEFACSCGCGFDTVDVELIRVLEQARADYTRVHGKCKIIITGGTRCLKRNSEIGGAESSKHLQGIACDHKIKVHDGNSWIDVPPVEVCKYYENKYPDKYGIGKYNSWVHLDIRPKRARW